MKDIFLNLVPELANYPVFLAIGELCLTLFFGGIFFSELWGLLRGYRSR